MYKISKISNRGYCNLKGKQSWSKVWLTKTLHHPLVEAYVHVSHDVEFVTLA